MLLPSSFFVCVWCIGIASDQFRCFMMDASWPVPCIILVLVASEVDTHCRTHRLHPDHSHKLESLSWHRQLLFELPKEKWSPTTLKCQVTMLGAFYVGYNSLFEAAETPRGQRFHCHVQPLGIA